MNAYNNAMDKIGAAIINWSDPTGTWQADREVREFNACEARRGDTYLYGATFLTRFYSFLQYYLGMVVV